MISGTRGPGDAPACTASIKSGMASANLRSDLYRTRSTGIAGASRHRRQPRRIMIPTAGSISSSTLSRPAPSATAARPMRPASSSVTKPSDGARDDVLRRRLRHAAVVVDHPRIAALTLDDRPEPLQRLSRVDRARWHTATRLGPILRDACERPACARSARAQFSSEIRTTAAFEHLDALDHLHRVADGPPSGSSMAVMSASVCTPVAAVAPAIRQRARSPRVFMNAPLPDLTSSTSAPMPRRASCS